MLVLLSFTACTYKLPAVYNNRIVMFTVCVEYEVSNALASLLETFIGTDRQMDKAVLLYTRVG